MTRTGSAASAHGMAYAILSAAWGEDKATELWGAWTISERAEAAAFAKEHFAPIIEKLAADLVAWKEDHADA